jgi:hypothetical protein
VAPCARSNRGGDETAHSVHLAAIRFTTAAVALALTYQFDLMTEQRQLHIEHPWGLESALAAIRTSPLAARMCSPF